MEDRATERAMFVGALAAVAFFFQQQALKLQRRETDRRLSDLNNEAGRLKQAVAANVSHDTWQAFAATYEKDGDRDQGRFEQIATFQNKLLGAIAISAVFVPVLTGVAVGVIVYLLTRHGVTVPTK